VTPIKPSVLELRTPTGRERYAVTGGFLEVRGDQVTVLARTAERPEEIDVHRAEAAKERAEERLREHAADLDIVRAGLALQRALVRLQLAQEAPKTTV
jgi:F-type H+-transporting ATPase subunit epsilon